MRGRCQAAHLSRCGKYVPRLYTREPFCVTSRCNANRQLARNANEEVILRFCSDAIKRLLLNQRIPFPSRAKSLAKEEASGGILFRRRRRGPERVFRGNFSVYHGAFLSHRVALQSSLMIRPHTSALKTAGLGVDAPRDK